MKMGDRIDVLMAISREAVEDDAGMARGLAYNLEAEGYDVVVTSDGEQGLRQARSGSFDLMLVDVMLPKRSGFEILKRLRADGIETPVILLTARAAEVDKVTGLKLGADDYVTKPFSLAELLARIGARLRRAEPELLVNFDSLRIERGPERAAESVIHGRPHLSRC